MMEHHRPRISLDLLRGFEAAARHLNFTHAAAELFVTQSAVSRQIKTLEEQLGKKLFVRANRQLALTEAGLSLQQAVTQAQDVLYAALDGVRPQPRATSLVVAVAEPFASLVLAPALGSLRLLGALKELRIVSANDPDEHARVRPHVTIRHYRQGAAPSGAVELAPCRGPTAPSAQALGTPPSTPNSGMKLLRRCSWSRCGRSFSQRSLCPRPAFADMSYAPLPRCQRIPMWLRQSPAPNQTSLKPDPGKFRYRRGAAASIVASTAKASSTSTTSGRHMMNAMHNHFQLRFQSLFDSGRGYAFPCDPQGHVDLDQLSERARNNYLYARAMVGRELAVPAVERTCLH